MTPTDPIYEPEFAFLPFACEDCGGRFFTADDVVVHKRETCHVREGRSHGDPFQLPDRRGVADGGRRT
jgi:hypothetical protein